MKKEQSRKSMRKKQKHLEEKTRNQITPKSRKSLSVLTNLNYLQLQVDTSGKKKQTLQRNIILKQKRIKELEQELKTNKQLVNQTLFKWRNFQQDLNYEKNKNQKLQIELKNAVQMCKMLSSKCKQYLNDHQILYKQNLQSKRKVEVETKKYKELRQLRKRQKAELKEFIIPFVENYLKGNQIRDIISNQAIEKQS